MLFDLSSHRDKIKLHRDAQLDDHLLLTTDQASSGFYYTLPTRPDYFYQLEIIGENQSEAKIFIYCESEIDQSRSLERKYFFSYEDPIKDRFLLTFQARTSLTRVGLLSFDQTPAKLQLDKFVVVEYNPTDDDLSSREESSSDDQESEEISSEEENLTIAEMIEFNSDSMELPVSQIQIPSDLMIDEEISEDYQLTDSEQQDDQPPENLNQLEDEAPDNLNQLEDEPPNQLEDEPLDQVEIEEILDLDLVSPSETEEYPESQADRLLEDFDVENILTRYTKVK